MNLSLAVDILTIMVFVDNFVNILEMWAHKVPLELFTSIGAFTEEIISPIVMTLSGSIASSQNKPLIFLFWLAIIGALAKTAGSWVIYWISDKLEDLLLVRFGKILGISHKDVEGFGKYLNKGNRDYFMITLLRAIPIMPTAPVSIASGFLKLNLKPYLFGTFLGTIFRNLFYLYFGYTSLGALESLNENLSSLETFGYIIMAAAFGALIMWFYKKRKEENSIEKILNTIQQKMTVFFNRKIK